MKKFTVDFFRYFSFLFIYILGKFFSKMLNNIEVSGRENIPLFKKGVCFLVNHRTIADSLWVTLAQMSIVWMIFSQNRIPANAADSKNFFSNPVKKIIFSFLKCIPVKRNTSNAEGLSDQVEKYIKVLEKNNLTLFFEGTRSRNGEIGPCKYGPASLVFLKSSSFKFIPVFLDDGISKIMPIKEGKIFTRISFFKKANIVFGSEIFFFDILEQEISEKEKIEKIKSRIRDSVLALKP